MKLRLDLHVHSEASCDGRMTLSEIIDAARNKGLDGVAITDHDVFFKASAADLPEDFIVIPGEEFSTERGHLLGLFLTEPVTAKGFHAVAAAIRAQGGLAVMAHPFERNRDVSSLDDVLPEIDGVEVWNGRANRKNPVANESALSLAERNKLPSFAGSDAHLEREVGNGFVTVEAEDRTPESIKKALLQPGNATGGREGRDIDVARSQLTKLKKRGGGFRKRITWAAFAAKCLACDALRPLRRRS